MPRSMIPVARVLNDVKVLAPQTPNSAGFAATLTLYSEYGVVSSNACVLLTTTFNTSCTQSTLNIITYFQHHHLLSMHESVQSQQQQNSRINASAFDSFHPTTNFCTDECSRGLLVITVLVNNASAFDSFYSGRLFSKSTASHTDYPIGLFRTLFRYCLCL